MTERDQDSACGMWEALVGALVRSLEREMHESLFPLPQLRRRGEDPGGHSMTVEHAGARRRVWIVAEPHGWDGSVRLRLRAWEASGDRLSGRLLADFCAELGESLVEGGFSEIAEADGGKCAVAVAAVASGKWMDSSAAAALESATRSGCAYATEVEASESGGSWSVDPGGRMPRAVVEIDAEARALRRGSPVPG